MATRERNFLFCQCIASILLVLISISPVPVEFSSVFISSASAGQQRQAPAQNGPNLPRIAVKNIDANESINSKYLDRELILSEVEKSLRGTRKFAVLTRDSEVMNALREEQQFASSSLSDGQAAYEGVMKAANYLVIPKVQRFSLYRKVVPVPNLEDKYLFSDHGLLEMHVKVYDTSTGELKGDYTVTSSRATEQEMTNSSSKAPNRTIYVSMVKSVAKQLSDQLVSALFPMIVIKAQGETIWINAGSDGKIKNGETLNVYSPGEELVDPYTGERLGSAEALVGKAKVVSVTPKFSTAKMLGGAQAMQGFIVRKP